MDDWKMDDFKMIGRGREGRKMGLTKGIKEINMYLFPAKYKYTLCTLSLY